MSDFEFGISDLLTPQGWQILARWSKTPGMEVQYGADPDGVADLPGSLRDRAAKFFDPSGVHPCFPRVAGRLA